MLLVFHPHVYPVFVIVGRFAVPDQFATNATLPSFVDVRFLKYVVAPPTFVLADDHAVVTLPDAVPYFAVVVFNPLDAVHPAKVCALLVACETVAPVELAFPVTVTVFVAFILNSVSYTGGC